MRDLVLLLVLALSGLALHAYITSWGIGLSPDSATYVGAARNLADGRGYVAQDSSGELRAVTHYPPLYPALLALVTRMGPDVLDAARWLGAALFSANVLLVGLLIRSAGAGRGGPALLAALFVFASVDMHAVHSVALSEPLFLALAISGLWLLAAALQSGRRSTLVASALILGGALLTRYTGAALLGTGVIGILLCQRGAAPRRWLDALLFGAVASAPMALWLWSNAAGGEPLTNRVLAFHPVKPAQLLSGVISAAGWLMPESIGWDGILWEGLRWVVLAAVGGYAAWVVGRDLVAWRRESAAPPAPEPAAPAETRPAATGLPTPRPLAALPLLLVVFMLLYAAQLLVSISFFDAGTYPDSRLMLPLLVAALIAVVVAGQRQLPRLHGSSVPRAACLVLVVIAGLRCAAWSAYAHEFGNGYGSRSWQTSQTMAQVSALPQETRIYTNARDAIELLTGRSSRSLPARYNLYSERANSAYEAQFETLRAELESGRAVVAWFDAITWREYLPGRDELQARLGRPPGSSCDDGAIFGAADASGPR